MKKILYIIPIVVFAMVGLTEDAKAQTGQTGNASNAVTQGATNAVIGSALTNTSTGSDNSNAGGGTTIGGSGSPAQASQPDATSTPSGGDDVGGTLTDSSVGFSAFPPMPVGTVTVSPGSSVTLSFGGFQPGEMTVASAPDAVTLA